MVEGAAGRVSFVIVSSAFYWWICDDRQRRNSVYCGGYRVWTIVLIGRAGGEGR
jgi:hypothetical protein